MGEPTDDNITHMLLALSGEVGECCNVWKKYLRGSISREHALELLDGEWADVFTYMMNIPPLIGLNPQASYESKRSFNAERFAQAPSDGGATTGHSIGAELSGDHGGSTGSGHLEVPR